LARAFWHEAGAAEPFPRDLRGPILWTLPLDLVDLPGLRLASVRHWLRHHGAAFSCDEADRPLRACLVAWRGHGFIFIDTDDSEDERRFSLAHELGHFLRDYWQPRRLACTRLGMRAAEVLDGERPPTPEERLSALLARVPIGLHTHLMHRDSAGRFASPEVTAAERAADRLAYELLAPAEAVLAAVHGKADRSAIAGLLREVYGLPVAQALDYSALLVPAGPPPDLLLRQLGLVK
jgi:hypothetical protein